MNKVIEVGNLTRDVEMRYSDNGTAVARYSIAVNRPFAKEGQQDVDFFNVVAFGKAAEFVSKYFSKGSRIIIEGRLSSETYEKKDGSGKGYAVQIIAERQEFGSTKGSGNQNGDQQGGNPYQNQNSGQQGGNPQQNQNGAQQGGNQRSNQNNGQAGSYQGQNQNGGYQGQNQNGQQPVQGGYPPNAGQASQQPFSDFQETNIDDFGFGGFADDSMFG